MGLEGMKSLCTEFSCFEEASFFGKCVFHALNGSERFEGYSPLVRR